MKNSKNNAIHEDLIDLKIAEERLKNLESNKLVIKSKKQFLKEMEEWLTK